MKLNERLAARLTKILARRQPMSRYHKALKDDVSAFGWRTALMGFCTAWLFFYLAQMLTQLWGISLLICLPAAVVAVMLLSAGIESHAHQTVRRHIERVKGINRYTITRRRPTLGVPYKRMAPVATADCARCGAANNKRHARTCPAIPPEWFNNPREDGASKR